MKHDKDRRIQLIETRRVNVSLKREFQIKERIKCLKEVQKKYKWNKEIVRETETRIEELIWVLGCPGTIKGTGKDNMEIILREGDVKSE